MPDRYETRQSIRRSLASELAEGYLLNIESVSTQEGNITRLHSSELVGENSFKGSQIFYGDDTPRVVKDHNSDEGWIEVSMIPSPPQSGVLELWQRPYTGLSINGVIGNAIDLAIDVGYVVEDEYEEWLMPGFANRFRLPAHIDKFRDVRSPEQSFTTANSVQYREWTLEQIQQSAGVTRRDNPGSMNEILLDLNSVGIDDPIMSVPIEYSTTLSTYDTVLIGIQSNEDVTLRINGGNTDKTIRFYANTPRVVSVVPRVGVTADQLVSVYNATGAPISPTLQVTRAYYYVNRAGLGNFRRMRSTEWRLDREDRSLQIVGPVGSRMRAATLIKMRTFRQPLPVESDTDLIEVPPSLLVEILKAKLLQDALPAPQQDNRGVAQRVGLATSKEGLAYRRLPRPSSSVYVGATSRALEIDVVDRELMIAIMAGYADSSDPGQVVAPLVTGSFSHLPATLSLDLPDLGRYIYISWNANVPINRIIIDGLDQTAAFTIEGNKAVSRQVVKTKPGDEQLIIGLNYDSTI